MFLSLYTGINTLQLNFVNLFYTNAVSIPYIYRNRIFSLKTGIYCYCFKQITFIIDVFKDREMNIFVGKDQE